MSNYQKVYMNQIHSSSLLCQLAHMWKTQVLCDAIIRTGTIITKAHRVVLVAACPMLQSMENAAAGSHLEVRLAADIKQESVNTFLQYLYEGFMMLTEENCREVEKVARLLQVDNVIKCCADFYKCLQNKTGATIPTQYKYSFQDMVEFRHVRTTDLQKTTQERLMKRTSEFNRPESPSHKRLRMHRGASPDVSGDRADDTASMSHSYMTMPDPWDRVPRLGSGVSKASKSQPGVIDIVEESLEMFQHDPHGKKDGPLDSRAAQKSAAVSIAISSQMNTEPDVSIVNISGAKDTGQSSAQRGSITVDPLQIDNSNVQISSSPSSSSSMSKQNYQSRSESHHRQPSQPQQQEFSPQVHHHQDVQFSSFSQDNEDMFSKQPPRSSNPEFVTSTPSRHHPVPVSLTTNQNKSFAIGSSSQSGPSSSPSTSRNIPGRPAPVSTVSSSQDYRGDKDPQNLKSEDSNSNDVDLSIVKVEAAHQIMSHSAPSVARGDETGGLDMHVDTEEGAVNFPQQGMVLQEQEGEELSDTELEDWAREEMSNEGSNISGEQNWFPQAYKDYNKDVGPYISSLLKTQMLESPPATHGNRYSGVPQVNYSSTSSGDSMKGSTMGHLQNVQYNRCGIDDVVFSRLSNIKEVYDLVPNEFIIQHNILEHALQSATGPGNFAKRLVERLYPELFTSENLRFMYSYNGGGLKEKNEMDPIRKNILKRYVLHFYPELEDQKQWNKIIVRCVNEGLRRPVEKKIDILKRAAKEQEKNVQGLSPLKLPADTGEEPDTPQLRVMFKPRHLHTKWEERAPLLDGQDPFSHIPPPCKLSLKYLMYLKDKSVSPKNFGRKVFEHLFPELFGPDNLRLKYSFFGGGKRDKLPLDATKCNYLKQYVLYFYPELELTEHWKAVIVTGVNEILRRPLIKMRPK